MQEWPQQFEELLGTVGLPKAELDCSLTEYVDIACGKEKCMTNIHTYMHTDVRTNNLGTCTYIRTYVLDDWEVITGCHSIRLKSPNQDKTLVTWLVRHNT